MKRVRLTIVTFGLIVVASLMMGAKRRGNAAQHTWHLAADAQLKLVTLWATYSVEDGKKVTDISYGGGSGGDDKAMTKPVDLSLGFKAGKGTIDISFDAHGGDKMTMSTPDGATFKERPQPPAVDHVTGEYQVLWVADWVKDGKVVQSIAYTVRGLPLDDKSMGVDVAGVAKLEKALLAAEAHPTTAPAAAKR